MSRHWFSRGGWCNCLCFALLLRLRGRVVRIVFRRTHFVGITRRGNAVHFKATRGGLPFLWFRGRPHAFRSKKWR